MSAEERLQASDPEGALEALQNDIRANPADPLRRIFLFQLLAVLGRWDIVPREQGEGDVGDFHG